jgi:glycosyltransferase involved in cell wall biosynthesis
MPGRACMLVHEYFPRDFRVRREARALRDAGWEIEIVCLRKPGQPARERVDQLDVTRLAVRRHRGSPLPVYLAEYLAFTAAAGALVAARQLSRHYDIVHVHAPPDFLIAAGLAAKLKGAKLVLDIHDLTPELYGSRFKSKGGLAARSGMRFVERGACELADRVITVTEAFADLLKKRGIAESKIVVVRNSPDPTAFDPRSRTPGEDGEFVIMHHGTLVRRYGIDLLVEAFGEMAHKAPRTRLHVYGEGDWLPYLKARAAELGLADKIVFFGEVAQEEVARALARADLCVVPNRSDDFTDLLLPTKLLEALHMGCPTISSATRVIAENFADGGVLLVPPGDVAALSSAMLQLATDPEKRSNLAAAGREQILRFAWEQEKQKLLDLYNDLQRH